MPSAGHTGLERIGVLGRGLSRLPGEGHWGLCQKREGLRGPEIIVHRGMGGPRVVQKWGEAGAEIQGPEGSSVPWRKLGPSVPSPNQVPQIKSGKQLLVLNSGYYRSLI